VAWVLLGRIRGDDFMVTKITLGLVLSAVGLGIALLPTMLYMATMGTPVGDMLGAEVVPSIPVYLVLSMIGVPPSIIGAITFRRGVRELVESQVLASRIGTAATSGRAGGQQSPQTVELQSSRPQRPQTEQRVPVPATQHPQRETVPRPSSALSFRIRTRSDSDDGHTGRRHAGSRSGALDTGLSRPLDDRCASLDHRSHNRQEGS
jgi:hypothetical protein